MNVIENIVYINTVKLQEYTNKFENKHFYYRILNCDNKSLIDFLKYNNSANFLKNILKENGLLRENLNKYQLCCNDFSSMYSGIILDIYTYSKDIKLI